MAKYKAALFDFDGTVIDTNQYILHTWQNLASKILKDKTFSLDYVKKYFGVPLYDTMVMLKEEFGVEDYTAEELCDVYRDWQKTTDEKPGVPCRGMDTAIKSLKEEGILLGIVTSRGNQNTRDILAMNDLDIFDATVGCDDTDIHKPEPEPALLCCEKLGVNPSECIMMGDSKFDTGCANNAGIDSVFCNWSECCRAEDLTGIYKPTFIVDSAEEFLNLFK